MQIFLSYQTDDRHVAAEISQFYEKMKIQTFMAHEDIGVSRLWQTEIISHLNEADIFIAVLSERYIASVYCLQESGIAVYREDALLIMPLMIDGTTPPGFMKHIQGKRYEPGRENDDVLFGGLAKSDPKRAIDLLISRLGKSGSWATAEKWFGRLRPYLAQASKDQCVDILTLAASNNQIAGARGLRDDLADLLAKHGQEIAENEREYIERFLKP